MKDPFINLFASIGEDSHGNGLTPADIFQSRVTMLAAGRPGHPPLIAAELPDSVVMILLRCGIPIVLVPSQYHLVDEFIGEIDEYIRQYPDARKHIQPGSRN